MVKGGKMKAKRPKKYKGSSRRDIYENGYRYGQPTKRDYAEPFRVFLPAGSHFQISIPGC